MSKIGEPAYVRMKGEHGNECKEKDYKKMASYICDWIGKGGRNDLGNLTWWG